MTQEDLPSVNWFLQIQSSAKPTISSTFSSASASSSVSSCGEMGSFCFTSDDFEKQDVMDDRPRNRHKRNVEKTVKVQFGEERPPLSYAELIEECIEQSAQKKMTLRQIYSCIMSKYAYFRNSEKSWKNSIRHNLSCSNLFVRVADECDPRGTGSFWTINTDGVRKRSTSPPTNKKNVNQKGTSVNHSVLHYLDSVKVSTKKRIMNPNEISLFEEESASTSSSDGFLLHEEESQMKSDTFDEIFSFRDNSPVFNAAFSNNWSTDGCSRLGDRQEMVNVPAMPEHGPIGGQEDSIEAAVPLTENQPWGWYSYIYDEHSVLNI